MIAMVESVGKRELKREARIAMRTVDTVYAGEHIADDDLKGWRMRLNGLSA
jgi:hypothetical protein